MVSGVYYPVRVLPDWMQAVARLSPVTHALEGSRKALLEGAGFAELRGEILAFLVMGAVFAVPLDLLIFHLGESYGKLERSGQCGDS